MGMGCSSWVPSLSFIALLICLSLRVTLLLFTIPASSSIFVRLNPPGYINRKGPAGEYRLFDKSSRDLDTLPLLPGPNPQDLTTRPLAGSLYQERDSHLTRFLYGSSDGWLEIVPDNRDPNWRSYDENGYYLFYYYCADVSPYLTQFWLSVSAWAMINILPLIILTILHNVNNIRKICTAPHLAVSGLVSHLQYSSPDSMSRPVSGVNMLLTAGGVCLTLWITTAGFGPGDGRHLRFVIPVFVLIPISLFSLLTSCTLLLVTRCTDHITGDREEETTEKNAQESSAMV